MCLFDVCKQIYLCQVCNCPELIKGSDRCVVELWVENILCCVKFSVIYLVVFEPFSELFCLLFCILLCHIVFLNRYKHNIESFCCQRGQDFIILNELLVLINDLLRFSMCSLIKNHSEIFS